MATETFNFSQSLRVVGQLLEALNITSFTLRVDDGSFLVRERVPRSNREITVRNSHAATWEIIKARDAEFKASFDTTGVLQFRVMQEDIAVLERIGRSLRHNSNKAPDTSGPAQVLRAIGGYVDQKNAQPLLVSKNNQNIYFEFEAPSREIFTEHFTISSLYDFWVNMVLRRKA